MLAGVVPYVSSKTSMMILARGEELLVELVLKNGRTRVPWFVKSFSCIQLL